jgi:hypothetical protein
MLLMFVSVPNTSQFPEIDVAAGWMERNIIEILSPRKICWVKTRGVNLYAPNQVVFGRTQSKEFNAENETIDETISHWSNIVHRDPSNLDNVTELYRAYCHKYRSALVAFPSTLRLHVMFVYRLSQICQLVRQVGIGELDWWPLVSTDDFMMIQPFMEKRFYDYVRTRE